MVWKRNNDAGHISEEVLFRLVEDIETYLLTNLKCTFYRTSKTKGKGRFTHWNLK
jgi:hypothetical protein